MDYPLKEEYAGAWTQPANVTVALHCSLVVRECQHLLMFVVHWAVLSHCHKVTMKVLPGLAL